MGLLLSCLRKMRGGQRVEVQRASNGPLDELLAREELGELLAALALVLDDRAGRARRALGGGVDLGPGTLETDLVRLDLQVLQVPGHRGGRGRSRGTSSASISRSSRSQDSTGFFLAAMMPLKEG